jgi:hypothetical protein
MYNLIKKHSKYQLKIANDMSLKEAIYRFRYDVYVQELDKFVELADHNKRFLYESQDDHSVHFYVNEDSELAGAVRLQIGSYESFVEDEIELLRLYPLLNSFGPSRIAIVSRFICHKKYRKGILPVQILLGLYHWQFSLQNSLIAVFALVEKHLLELYSKFGLRRYTHNFVYLKHNREAPRIPMVLLTRDYQYLKEIKSIYYYVAKEHNFPEESYDMVKIRELLPQLWHDCDDSRLVSFY